MTPLKQEQERGGHADERGESRYVLRLYVAGDTIKSETALTNLRKICERHLKGRYEIQVIDLLTNPQLAANEHILAVPTLIRLRPPPSRRLIGDLSNTERVLSGLGISGSGAFSEAH